MTDSSGPTMEVLAGATGITIDRSHFSNVGRDQYNYYTTYQTIVQPRERRRRIEKDTLELSQFTEIKHGDIYKDKDVCYSWRLCSNGKDATEAAVYIAQIMIAGSFGESKFTVKTYRGRNAMKEWRRDFRRSSKDWCGDVPLFGYNKSSVPLLIFHGELVPLSHVDVELGDLGMFYIEILKNSLGCSRNELWMDPTKGRFCRGPIGPQCRAWREDDVNITVPSDVDCLKEDNLIRYFSNRKHDWGFFWAVSYSACHFQKLEVILGPTNNQIQLISGLTNSTIAFTQILRWWSREGCLCDGQVMSDGATRFRLRSEPRLIEIFSDGERNIWLSQAWSVFDALNISLEENLSTYKLAYPFVRLKGALQNSKRKRERRQLCAPIYLFLIPDPSEHFYHWSFDLTGQNPFSSDKCKYLGLPFKLSVVMYRFERSWPTKVYKAVRDFQIVRGFDPKTPEFARYLGWPVFEIVAPSENRFQELETGMIFVGFLCDYSSHLLIHCLPFVGRRDRDPL
ncbi:hypothetical protein E1B28_011815 [Marasmius oreades]|uniref:Uncharacterized protein n=1 Tax=Marasmius oreades TaxID=181124 RepID=A0A9P7UQC8_9AGAR|nr:uncharacterized protein E1B28_011815 [Marasmius oreades]KAG7090213.1 hypothetical protein E1B28_011815 [Marasmius oreades]